MWRILLNCVLTDTGALEILVGDRCAALLIRCASVDPTVVLCVGLLVLCSEGAGGRASGLERI